MSHDTCVARKSFAATAAEMYMIAQMRTGIRLEGRHGEATMTYEYARITSS